MDDKDETGEARGAEDALRPTRPGGERKSTGETDQSGTAGRQGGAMRPPGGALGTEAGEPDDRAAGTIDNPIPAGDGFGTNDFQTGDRAELAQQRGGPVDITRDRPKRR